MLGFINIQKILGNRWVAILMVEYNVDHFGYAVAISDDGKRVVGGAKYNRNHPIGNAS